MGNILIPNPVTLPLSFFLSNVLYLAEYFVIFLLYSEENALAAMSAICMKLKTGKMMLYDSKREAITIEFRVYDIDNIGGDFQFSNKFMQEDVKIFEPGIPLSVIEKIGHFNGFGHKRRVDWKLHRDEYNMLLNRYQGKIINFMKDLDDK